MITASLAIEIASEQVLIEQSIGPTPTGGHKSRCGSQRKGIRIAILARQELRDWTSAPTAPRLIKDRQIEDRNIGKAIGCWATVRIVHRRAQNVAGIPCTEGQDRLELAESCIVIESVKLRD